MDTKTLVGLVAILVCVLVGWLMVKDFNRDKSKHSAKVQKERDTAAQNQSAEEKTGEITAKIGHQGGDR